MKAEIKDIIDCILKFDSKARVGQKAVFFDAIQRDLRKAIAQPEQPRDQEPEYTHVCDKCIKIFIDNDPCIGMNIDILCPECKEPKPDTPQVEQYSKDIKAIDLIKSWGKASQVEGMTADIVTKMQHEFEPNPDSTFKQGIYSGYAFGLQDGYKYASQTKQVDLRELRSELIQFLSECIIELPEGKDCIDLVDEYLKIK